MAAVDSFYGRDWSEKDMVVVSRVTHDGSRPFFYGGARLEKNVVVVSRVIKMAAINYFTAEVSQRRKVAVS